MACLFKVLIINFNGLLLRKSAVLCWWKIAQIDLYGQNFIISLKHFPQLFTFLFIWSQNQLHSTGVKDLKSCEVLLLFLRVRDTEIAQSTAKWVCFEKWMDKHLYCHSKWNLIFIFLIHTVDVMSSHTDVNPLEMVKYSRIWPDVKAKKLIMQSCIWKQIVTWYLHYLRTLKYLNANIKYFTYGKFVVEFPGLQSFWE